MSGTSPPAPAQQPPGPVRSPRGLVDVTVEPSMLVLTRHVSWRDWFESELLLGLAGIGGLVLIVLGLTSEPPLRWPLVVLGALLFVPVLLVFVAQYVLVGWFAVRTLVLLLSGSGRERLRSEVADTLAQFGEVELGWRVPRGQLAVPAAVSGGVRPRLVLATPSGPVRLSVPFWRRSRLEHLRRTLAA